MTRTWRFRALDTLFFRDARPHGSVGAAILGSLFPPSARTVAGAVRFLIGTALGVDWAAFGRAGLDEGFAAGGCDVLRLIGRHDEYGSLRFSGPWLAVRTGGGWQRLYPAPRTLISDKSGRPVGHLEIGPRVECDLGSVYLPAAPERGHRPVDRLWLDGPAFAQAMAGRVPSSGIYPASALFAEEARLGIGRNLDRHTTEQGLLYQTRHVRPREAASPAGSGRRAKDAVCEVAVEIAVTCGDEAPEGIARLVRLGGEGRLAEVDVEPEDAGIPSAPEPTSRTLGLVVVLLTSADLGGSWLPPGFSAHPGSGQPRAWRGELRGIPLTVHSAVIGPAVREGGWDLAARKPRPVRSLAPAGAAWYLTVDDASGGSITGEALAPAIRVLHGARLADDALGHGQLAVGLFDSTRFPHLEAPR
jgi:CRISPR-associated protein Cmr3